MYYIIHSKADLGHYFFNLENRTWSGWSSSEGFKGFSGMSYIGLAHEYSTKEAFERSTLECGQTFEYLGDTLEDVVQNYPEYLI